MKRLIGLFLAIALFHINASAQEQEVSIPGSQLRRISSSIVKGQEYVLHISLPRGYESSNKKYPVVYLMDSQWDFPLLTALYGEQYYDGFVPELIIVGVTWGGTNPRHDSLRARDYTPTHEDGPFPQSGGAPQFLSFMKNELFPYIESNFKADKNDRALAGCSFGGLFTLYALFAEPGLFQRYIAASPAYDWNREVIYKYEQAYYEKKPTAPARLFLTMGGVERGVPGYEKLVKHLQSRNYSNLAIKSTVLENTGHSGTKGETYARGLQYIYERPSLKLSPAVLNKYVGKYSFERNQAEIKNENGQLALYFGSNNRTQLYAASETEFYSTHEFFNVRFKTSNGIVEGLELERFGGSGFAKKNK